MKLKYMWAPFSLFFLGTLGYIISEVLKANDPISEVFYNNNTEKILIISFIIYILIISVMCILCKNENYNFDFDINSNICAGIFGITVFGLLVIDSSIKFIDYILSNSNIYILILAISGTIASISFLLLSLSYLLKKNYFEKISLLSLLPVIWACIRAIVIIFMDSTNIHSNRLMILAIISEILFLFTQAKLVSNIIGCKTSKRIVLLGLIAGIFIGVYAIPMLFTINDIP